MKKVAAGGTATRKLAQRLGRTLDKLSSGASSGGNKTNPPGVHPSHQPPQQYVVYSPHGPPGPHQVSLQQYPPHSGYFQPPGYYPGYGGHQAIVYPGPHWAAEPHPIGVSIEPFLNTHPIRGKCRFAKCCFAESAKPTNAYQNFKSILLKHFMKVEQSREDTE